MKCLTSKSLRLSLSIVFLVVCPFLSYGGSNKPNRCSNSSVRGLDIDQAPYQIKYQVLPEGISKVQDQEVVLIYIQGGPGGYGILDLDQSNPLKNIPQIRMDLRGTGCSQNIHGHISDVELSTDIFVQDWMAVIKDLKLKSVVIFGGSFGTIVATKLAHTLERQGDVEVRGVLLAGTIGKTGIQGRLQKGFVEKWNDLKRIFPLLETKPGEDLAAKLSLEEDLLVKTLVAALNLGYYYVSTTGDISHLFLDLESAWEQRSKDEGSDYWDSLMRYVRSVYDKNPDQQYLYKKINCEEIIPNGNEYNLRWVKGTLALSNQSQCDGFEWKKPYLPSDYPIKAPITYVEGGLDPNTPIEGAFEHLQSQNKADRTFVLVHQGGHGALMNGLTKCYSSIVNKIRAGKAVRTIKNCGLPAQVINYGKGSQFNISAPPPSN